MRWFPQLRWPFKLSSVSSAEPSSPKNCLMVLESTAKGRNDWLRERFVETADTEHWICFGKKAAVHLSSVATWLPETKNSSPAASTNDYYAKLVQIGRRKDSLLMRVDFHGGPHDVTYVFGKTFLKIRVQTLNPSRTWSGWTKP